MERVDPFAALTIYSYRFRLSENKEKVIAHSSRSIIHKHRRAGIGLSITYVLGRLTSWRGVAPFAATRLTRARLSCTAERLPTHHSNRITLLEVCGTPLERAEVRGCVRLRAV